MSGGGGGGGGDSAEAIADMIDSTLAKESPVCIVPVEETEELTRLRFRCLATPLESRLSLLLLDPSLPLPPLSRPSSAPVLPLLLLSLRNIEGKNEVEGEEAGAVTGVDTVGADEGLAVEAVDGATAATLLCDFLKSQPSEHGLCQPASR